MARNCPDFTVADGVVEEMKACESPMIVPHGQDPAEVSIIEIREMLRQEASAGVFVEDPS